MSNIDKISFNDLAEQIAQQANISKKKAETFLRAFQGSIEEGLTGDREVKIKGFGKFKLNWNDARKSVNIHTGEAITIAGHHKVSFTPEVALRDLINAPYQKLSEVTINEKSDAEKIDPIEKLSREAEEIKSMLSDLYLNKVSAAPLPKEDTPLPAPVKEVVVEKPKEGVKPTANTIAVSRPIAQSDKVIDPNQQPHLHERDLPVKKSNKKAGKIILLILILLALLGGAAYFVWKNNLLRPTADWIGNQVYNIGSQAENLYAKLTISTPEEQKQDSTQTETEQADTLSVKETPVVPQSKEKTIFEQERTYKSFITTEVMTKGTRLTLLAEKHYGNRSYWVYIYEANRSTIPNPDNVAIGTRLRIPRLPAELIDTKNPATIDYANSLEKFYVEK